MSTTNHYITREEYSRLENFVIKIGERQAATEALLGETIRRGEKTENLLQEIRQAVSDEREERKRRDQIREKERKQRERNEELRSKARERRIKTVIYAASVIGPLFFSIIRYFLGI